MEEENDIIDEYYDHVLNRKKARSKSKRIAFELWNDLNGRRGVGFDDVDHEIQCEALEKWIGIIKRGLKK